MTSRTRNRTAPSRPLQSCSQPHLRRHSLLPSNDQGGAQPVPRVQHLRTVTTTPASGKFRCGRLRLTITHGTETEVFEGLETRGVTFIDIHRRWNPCAPPRPLATRTKPYAAFGPGSPRRSSRP
jgi:hypothetical protein